MLQSCVIQSRYTFKEKIPLKSLTSSILIPEEAKADILRFSQKGQEHFDF